MKATVVGATVPAKTLRTACARVDLPSKDVRVVGPRAWVYVPPALRDAVLAKLADTLGTGLMVIDVDLSAGGEALQASRATYRGVEEDVTGEARELLADVAGRAIDEAAMATALAWGLVGDADATAAPAEANAEEQWAQALVDKLT